MKRLVVQWPRLGPYHLARLRATHRLLASRDVELVALETASQDQLYAWREETADESFRRVQAFPGRAYESISPREMFTGVCRSLDRLQPDAVAIHSYALPDSQACLHWCRLHRKGAVVMTDSKADDAARHPLRERIKARLLAGYDTAVTAGTASRAYLTGLGFPSERIWTGYDVVDNAYFSRETERRRREGSRPKDLDVEGPFFLASNRFLERKNLATLVSAYADYRAERPDPWPLVLLGDGPLRSELETLAGPGVVFAGFRQIEEIPDFYTSAAVFVHPARVDQWALVVNEAMASGLPVIVSTGTGAHHDLVRPGENGFVFNPDDRTALAELLGTVHSADLAPMARRSSEIIRDWGLDRFASAIAEAARMAVELSDRRYPPVTRALISALRLTARSATSFHTVEY